ncbi:hypothetical protein BMF94_6026 [Rhodotorula taiwanensis]|uniref:GrpE protein homolog n=1 Tax=Rhodotorula taiwanensis TaxID=741276 RepID=A0A2S5B2G0_9BASI|nr:hypothetical protein BMF94_6026 [Rhodotorula taiwanensis]
MHAVRSAARVARPCLPARTAAATVAPSVAVRPGRAFSPATFLPRPVLASSPRLYSTASTEAAQEPAATPQPGQAAPTGGEAATAPSGSDAKVVEEMTKLLDEQKKIVAELKDARLRTLADFENLQKISVREKQQAKDFALQSFAKDLIAEIDVLNMALRSIPAERLTAVADSAEKPNPDLVGLHEGVKLTKRGIEKVLSRHGIIAFDPTGEQFDPNRHEALYQAPVPGKEPGSVLECQEIGYMIKDRLLRPAKVGVVLAQE